MIDTDWTGQLEVASLAGDSPPTPRHAELVAYLRHKTGCSPDPVGVRSAHSGEPSIAIASVVTSEHLILFTSGMSDRPMTVPSSNKELRYAELVMFLPRNWPTRPVAGRPESAPWKWLQYLARFPHDYDTWLGGPFATISTDELPATQVEGCPYAAFMLLYNQHFPSFESSDGRRINLITVIPLIPKNRDWQRCQPPALWNPDDDE